MTPAAARRTDGVRRGLLAAAPLLLAGCGPASIVDPAGPVGRAEMLILANSLAIMLVIVLPTMAAVLGVAWWFRASNPRARYRPDWAFSGRIETVVWAIPLMVIMLLGGVTWVGSHRLDPARPIDSPNPPLPIQVVSLDWKWLFVYPTLGIASVNRLVVPSAVPLSLQLSSGSVWNTFFVPRLGGMIYTMPGMSTRLHLMADAPGRYHGQSAHFSGDGFPDMHFEVVAVDAAAFDAWVQAQRRSPDRLDDDAYRRLSAQGTAPVASYGTVAPGLYHRIHTLQLPPGPGPAATPERSARTPAERLRIDAFVCSAS